MPPAWFQPDTGLPPAWAWPNPDLLGHMAEFDQVGQVCQIGQLDRVGRIMAAWTTAHDVFVAPRDMPQAPKAHFRSFRGFPE
jgi:hypothetical protein